MLRGSAKLSDDPLRGRIRQTLWQDESECLAQRLQQARFNARHEIQIQERASRLAAAGYGLTLGVNSRIETTWRRISSRVRVGNLYVNRNMTGAVVGAQPFGGEGSSGTGPKAGGPYYLHRFATERTRSVTTAAMGGNTGLLSLSED